MDEKQKKIAELRDLLGEANSRIKALKQNLIDKEKQIEQIRTDYEKKLKNMELDEGLIMKQYQERLIRIQKSLEDSENVIAKYKNLHFSSSKSFEGLMNEIAKINSLILKSFAPLVIKDNNEAVEQLCAIQKYKDFQQKIDKIQQEVPMLSQLIKSIKKLSTHSIDSLNKKRELRLLFMKKQVTYQKQLQNQQNKYATSKGEIQKLQQELKNMQILFFILREEKYQKKIQTIAKSKAKISEEKVNLQFIKQLFIKVVIGPKEASLMAFEVLSKVLKLTPDEYTTAQKKIK